MSNIARKSEVPPFTIDGVTFVCWIAESGLYEWRSKCGRAVAGRDVRVFWARANGADLGRNFVTLRLAMECAAKALNKRVAA